MTPSRSNNRTALHLSLIIVGMAALTAASVPLYNIICRATGWAGTPRVAAMAPTEKGSGSVEILFDADTAPGLPWSFEPVERRTEISVGEQKLSFYEARNDGSSPIVGTAVFNVTPLKIGNYFVKIDCFCFERQLLEPGQTAQLPVSYYVDAEMLDDPNTSDVRQITLSYTFFVDEEATADAQRRSAGRATEISNET